ncbi:hypothetical protein ACFOY2_05330 [Nonomuraea purpurea]|uniref:Uncharacterized protein n=1 Tax=Nonomuraea purpurea TaxID=1849276 RepID=A0ABV8FY01_9ACTN
MADMSTADREKAAKQGQAMSGGRFPIRNRQDLQNAIRAVGRVRPNTDEARALVRRHIIKRAKALDLAPLIPEDWAVDGSLKS